MKKLRNIHPGEVLSEEFLVPLSMSAYRLSMETKIPQSRISQIIKGQRSITADTALRLAAVFGTTPQFWLGLQDDYDIEEQTGKLRDELRKIHRYNPEAQREKRVA